MLAQCLGKRLNGCRSNDFLANVVVRILASLHLVPVGNYSVRYPEGQKHAIHLYLSSGGYLMGTVWRWYDRLLGP